jgi:EmrB/QacA subfamily drug resistance transporter
VNWRLIFYINVPIGVIGTFLALAVLPAFPGSPGRRFDLPGFLCIATGLFALLLALSEGQDWGWTSYPVLILVVAGLLSLALFVVIELEVDEPLLNVRVFTHWPFVNSLLLISVLSIGLFAVLFYVPLFLQEGQQMQALNAGLTIFPQALVMAVLMPIAGRLYDRFGPRWPAVIGVAIAGAGTLLLCGINPDMTRTEVVEWTMFRAAGLGLAMMPIMTGGLSSLPPSMTSAGSAFNNLVQRVSMALGLAALTAMATAQQAQFMADRSALLESAGEQINPQLQAMQQQGLLGLYPLMQRTQLDVLAETYSNVFLVAGVCTLLGVILAFMLRSGAAKSGSGEREAVEIG